VFAAAAWAGGGFRRPVPWRTACGCALLMLILGALVFLVAPTRRALGAPCPICDSPADDYKILLRVA